MNYRHINNCEYVLYNDLLPNDLVWVQGELFKIVSIWGYKKNDIPIIRFIGAAVNGWNRYIMTGFDGGTYGAGARERATIVNRSLANHIR